MRRWKSGPALNTVVLQLHEYYYVLRITQRGTMLRLLGECDNGKGGKSYFIKTTTIVVKKQSDLTRLQEYITYADEFWGRYKPKRFGSFEQAVQHLKERKNVLPDKVSLYVPSN